MACKWNRCPGRSFLPPTSVDNFCRHTFYEPILQKLYKNHNGKQHNSCWNVWGFWKVFYFVTIMLNLFEKLLLVLLLYAITSILPCAENIFQKLKLHSNFQPIDSLNAALWDLHYTLFSKITKTPGKGQWVST